MANQKMVELFHSEYPREIQGDDYLQHYGILGQKWGIRRFQPYPKGYHGDGKFIDDDKRQQNRKHKQNYKETKRVLKLNGKTLSGIHATARYALGNKFLNDPKVKRVINSYNKADRLIAEREMDVEEHYPNDKVAKKRYDEASKKWDKERKKLNDLVEKEVEDFLGKYGDKPLKIGYAPKGTYRSEMISALRDLAIYDGYGFL